MNVEASHFGLCCELCGCCGCWWC